MRTYKQITRQVEDKVYCDICGVCCTIDNIGQEYATLEASWGYGSQHDGEKYELHLCEKCFFDTIVHMKSQRYSYLKTLDNHPFKPTQYNV